MGSTDECASTGMSLCVCASASSHVGRCGSDSDERDSDGGSRRGRTGMGRQLRDGVERAAMRKTQPALGGGAVARQDIAAGTRDRACRDDHGDSRPRVPASPWRPPGPHRTATRTARRRRGIACPVGAVPGQSSRRGKTRCVRTAGGRAVHRVGGAGTIPSATLRYGHPEAGTRNRPLTGTGSSSPAHPPARPETGMGPTPGGLPASCLRTATAENSTRPPDLPNRL
jgi:hypothetical protein